MRTEKEIKNFLAALKMASEEMETRKEIAGMYYFGGQIEAIRWVLGENKDD